MIRLEHVTKTFRGRRALDDVSLEVARGEMVGLLGPNGAGKSTLIGALVGQVRPEAGTVSIGGVEVRRDRARALRRVGAVFEAPGFYERFTGRENIACLASLSGEVGLDEVDQAVAFVGLTDRIHERVRGYSRGMRLRLAIAQALVPRPEVVVLDEPMEGLDPAGIRDVRELVRRLRTEWGLTVLFSSHLLREVEQLCDRVAILRHGRVVYEGPCAEGAGGGLEQRYLAAMEGA